MEFDAETMKALAAVLSQASSSANASNQVRDSQQLTGYGMQENAKAAQDRLALAAPGARLGTSMRASMLNNFQPTKVNWGGPGSGLRGEIPTFSGGAAAGLANLDPRTKSLSDRVMLDELLGQMRGGLSGGGMDTQVDALPSIGKSSTADKVLGGASTAAGVLGALGKNAAGGNVDLTKLFQSLFGNKGGTNPNTVVGPDQYSDPNRFTGPDQYGDPDLFSGPEDPFSFIDYAGEGGNSPVNPSQLPGYADPMDEIRRARAGGSEESGGRDASGDDTWDWDF